MWRRTSTARGHRLDLSATQHRCHVGAGGHDDRDRSCQRLPTSRAAPGQAAAASYLFNLTRGMFENINERDTVTALTPSGQALAVDNTFDVFNAAAAKGIGFTDITSGENLNVLDGLDIPADAKAQDTTDVLNGFSVIVPNQSVVLNGVTTIAWAEINLATGEYIGVDADGGHEGALEFLALVGEGLELQIQVIKFFSPVVAFDVGQSSSVAYQLNVATGDQKAAAAALAIQKMQAKEGYESLIQTSETVSELLGDGRRRKNPTPLLRKYPILWTNCTKQSFRG